MKLCWHEDPEERPTFKIIVREMSKFTTPSNENAPFDEASNDYLKPVRQVLTKEINAQLTGPNPSKELYEGDQAHISVAHRDIEFETCACSGRNETDDDRAELLPSNPVHSTLFTPKRLGRLCPDDVQLLAELQLYSTAEANVKLTNSMSRKKKRSASFHSHPTNWDSL